MKFCKWFFYLCCLFVVANTYAKNVPVTAVKAGVAAYVMNDETVTWEVVGDSNVPIGYRRDFMFELRSVVIDNRFVDVDVATIEFAFNGNVRKGANRCYIYHFVPVQPFVVYYRGKTRSGILFSDSVIVRPTRPKPLELKILIADTIYAQRLPNFEAPEFLVKLRDPNGESGNAMRLIVFKDDTVGVCDVESHNDSEIKLSASFDAPGSHSFVVRLTRPGLSPVEVKRSVIVVCPPPVIEMKIDSVYITGTRMPHGIICVQFFRFDENEPAICEVVLMDHEVIYSGPFKRAVCLDVGRLISGSYELFVATYSGGHRRTYVRQFRVILFDVEMMASEVNLGDSIRFRVAYRGTGGFPFLISASLVEEGMLVTQAMDFTTRKNSGLIIGAFDGWNLLPGWYDVSFQFEGANGRFKQTSRRVLVGSEHGLWSPHRADFGRWGTSIVHYGFNTRTDNLGKVGVELRRGMYTYLTRPNQYSLVTGVYKDSVLIRVQQASKSGREIGGLTVDFGGLERYDFNFWYGRRLAKRFYPYLGGGSYFSKNAIRGLGRLLRTYEENGDVISGGYVSGDTIIAELDGTSIFSPQLSAGLRFDVGNFGNAKIEMRWRKMRPLVEVFGPDVSILGNDSFYWRTTEALLGYEVMFHDLYLRAESSVLLSQKTILHELPVPVSFIRETGNIESRFSAWRFQLGGKVRWTSDGRAALSSSLRYDF